MLSLYNGESTPNSSKTVTVNCPVGWIDSVEGCFFFNFEKDLTWREAQIDCQNLGGFLAEPKTGEQQSLLTSMAYVEQSQIGVNSWWIGLTDQGHENRWIWQHSVEDVTVNNWAPESPAENSPGKDCAVMNSFQEYKWTDQDCDESLAFPICQIDSDDNGSPTTS